MVSKFQLKSINLPKEGSATEARKTIKTLTSFGASLNENDHIIEMHEDDDDAKGLITVCTLTLTSGSKTQRETEEKKPEPK